MPRQPRATRTLGLEALETRATPAAWSGSVLVEFHNSTPFGSSLEGSEPVWWTSSNFHSFRLVTPPTAPVSITLVPNDAQINAFQRGSYEPSGLTFELSATKPSIDIFISAVDDHLLQGDRTLDIDMEVASDDPAFNGINSKSIPLFVRDNESLISSTSDSGPGTLRAAMEMPLSYGEHSGDVYFDQSLAGKTIAITKAANWKLAGQHVDASALNERVIIERQASAPESHLFEASGDTSITGLSIRNFRGRIGSAILATSGSLLITDCEFENNQNTDIGGAVAALAPVGNVTIVDSEFRSNQGDSGAIYMPGSGRLTAYRSTFLGNLTGGTVINGNSVLLVNCTVSSDSSNKAIIDASSLELRNSTIVSSTALPKSPIPILRSGDLKVFSSIILGNADGEFAKATEVRNTLIGNPADGQPLHGVNGNIVGKDDGKGGRVSLAFSEVLLPLGMYGGPTATHALIRNSPAINGGREEQDPFNPGASLTTDQRGIGFARKVGPAVDMGAYEQPENTSPSIPSTALFAIDGTTETSAPLAVDKDLPEQSLAFTLAGEDAPQFTLLPDGRLQFRSPPSFASPADADRDNKYQVELTVDDGWGGVVSQAITITVVDAWRNSTNPLDVNNDGQVTPLDALLVINELNMRGPSAGLSLSAWQGSSPAFQDVSNDGEVTALDALLVINHLNSNTFQSQSVEVAEAEPAAVMMGYCWQTDVTADLKRAAKRAAAQPTAATAGAASIADSANPPPSDSIA